MLTAHRQIFDAIRDHSFLGRTLDFRTLAVVLGDGVFESEMAKRQYISGLISCFVSQLNAKEYALQIRKAYNNRRIRQVAESPMPEAEKASAMSELWRTMGNAEGDGFVSLQTAMEKTLDRIGETYKRGRGFDGLATGISDLDAVLSGLENGGLYVLAGRPAMGKTAAALSIAMNAATTGNSVLLSALRCQLSN